MTARLDGALTVTARGGDGAAVTLPPPVEWELVRSFDSPADSFTAVFPYEQACGGFHSVEVTLGGRRIFYGGVDETSATAGAAGRRLKLLARGPGAVLLDNEALPWIYTNIDLQRIFDEHIKPYGFETLVYDNNAIFNHYQVQKGMSEWEVLYNFARNASSLPAYIDSEGRVVCPSEWPPAGSLVVSNSAADALRFSSVKVTDNRYSPITRFVIRDEEGVYSYSYDNPETDALGLTRIRYLIPSVEYMQGTSGRLDASLRVHRSMLGKFVAEAVCPGFWDVALRDSARLDTGVQIYEDLFVHQVRYRLSQDGAQTFLTMLDKRYV